jgi:hypothetical protein
VMAFLPFGVYDTIRLRRRDRRLARQAAAAAPSGART